MGVGLDLVSLCRRGPGLPESEGSERTDKKNAPASARLIVSCQNLGVGMSPSRFYAGFQLYMTAPQWPISRVTRDPRTRMKLPTVLLAAAV